MDRIDGPLAGGADKTKGRKFERLVEAHCQISASPPAGDDIGFLCSDFVRFTLPHRAIAEHFFGRADGAHRVSFMAEPSIGLPYGKWPRLLLIYLTTQALRTQSREINLGASMSHFMKLLCASVTGGQNGSIGQFKQQLLRTAAMTSAVSLVTDRQAQIKNAPLADEFEVHWVVVCTDQKSGLPARIRLGERIYGQMLTSAVPLDMRAVRAIQQSPLAMDVYAWSTFRAHHVAATHAARIPWASLQRQFGAGYDSESDFKIAFRFALTQVQMVYPALRCEATQSHFLLRRSAPSVPRRPPRSTPPPSCG